MRWNEYRANTLAREARCQHDGTSPMCIVCCAHHQLL
jgi:hypothetical protein